MKFRDHLNGHNKHVVRLAEKELTTSRGKKYLLFALQLTGGGNFPSRHCHPEAAINAMWANTVPVLGMEVRIFKRNNIGNDKSDDDDMAIVKVKMIMLILMLMMMVMMVMMVMMMIMMVMI